MFGGVWANLFSFRYREVICVLIKVGISRFARGMPKASDDVLIYSGEILLSWFYINGLFFDFIRFVEKLNDAFER